jgi:hypothetical protein
MKVKFLSLAIIAAMTFILLPALVMAYGYDIDNIYYKDSQIEIDYYFDGDSKRYPGDGDRPPYYDIPDRSITTDLATNPYDAWEVIKLNGSVGLDGEKQLFNMSLDPGQGENVMSLGGTAAEKGLGKWSYRATFKNFDTPVNGQFHGPTLNAHYNDHNDKWNAELHAYWYTGEGSTKLRLTGEINGFGEWPGWESGATVLEGFDPATSELTLQIDVSDKNKFLASYILSDDTGTSQGDVAYYTLSQGDLLGYGASHPGVFQQAGDIPASVPVPAAVWLLGSGLVGLVGFRRKIRR